MAWDMDNKSRAVGLIVAAIVGAIVAGALALSSVRNAEATVDDVSALHAVELTLLAQDTAMARIGQAVLLAEDAAIGVVRSEEVTVAATAADQAVSAVENRFASLPQPARDDLSARMSAWSSAATSVVAMTADIDPASATSTMVVSLSQVTDALVDGLTSERDARAAALEDTEGGLGLAGRAIGFLVIFLLPLGAILAYRISARRQLDTAVSHLDTRIEAEKLTARAKDQFIADFAKDLQPPLSSIREISEQLLEGRSPSAAEELTAAINAQSDQISNRMADLEIAAADRVDPSLLDPATFDVKDQIDAVIATFAKRGHLLGGTYGAGAVVADASRLQQILRNLIANAIAHGGADIRIYGDVAGRNYFVSVEDNGPGLGEEAAAEFSARTIPLTAGSAGLGLGVAQLLATAMGGLLEYERVAGRTAFVLALPVATELESEEAAALIPAEQ